jgi:hypothetical protein
MQAHAEPADPALPDVTPAKAPPAPVRSAETTPANLAPAPAPRPVRADVTSTAALGAGPDRGGKVPSVLFEHKSVIEQAMPMGGKADGEMASLAPPKAAPLAPSTRALEGKWAANKSACSDGKKRTSHLPLTIDSRGAKAGAASCSFGKTEQSGNRWAIAAQCRQARKSWDANVQLVLSGGQLTWTSERGTQTYTRCL